MPLDQETADAVIYLRGIGYSTDQIANTLDIKSATLKGWLHAESKVPGTKYAELRKRWDAIRPQCMGANAKCLMDAAQCDPAVAYRVLQANATGWGVQKHKIAGEITISPQIEEWFRSRRPSVEPDTSIEAPELVDVDGSGPH